MDLIRHTIAWTRGEIFEMTVIAFSGLLLTLSGIVFSRFGSTPLAKAMLAPLVIVGLFYTTLGIVGYLGNHRRIPAFEQAHREDPENFARTEKIRVEGFQYMYRITNVVAPLCFALSTAIFWLSLNPHARAIGMALVVFGLFGFLIDAFSKERADIYHARILDSLGEAREQAADRQ